MKIIRIVEKTHYTIDERIAIAKKITARAATRKDYLVRSKRDRAFVALAKEWTAGKGYIIRTTAEMNDEFGELAGFRIFGDERDSKKLIWYINDSMIRSKYKAKSINFSCI